jgi:DNA replication and repair protein RecF
LKLAQASQYREVSGQGCLFLLDDLPAELDTKNRKDVMEYLNSLECQYFVTGVDKNDFSSLFEGINGRMFHVEQGTVSDL